MELDEASCSSVVDLPESFRIPQNTEVSDGFEFCKLNSTEVCTRKAYPRKLNLSKKDVRKRKNRYDHPMPIACIDQVIKDLDYEGSIKTSASQFKKREMTTIHEEDFQYKKIKSKSRRKVRCKSCGKIEVKEYKEKVASLKVIISRLQKTFLAQPKVLPNHIPDETIQLFQKIHI